MSEFEYKKVSKAGGITLPVKTRRGLSISPGDPVEIETEDNGDIVLRRYAPRCTFCGTDTDVAVYKGKGICRECAEGLKGADTL